jgi:chromosome condensin MukBEF ATPase and DNA-binding subunit MukB
MNEDEIICRETFAFLKERACDLFFILSVDGTVVEVNKYARNFIGRALIGEKFQDIIIDFMNEFKIDNLKNDRSEERLIHIGNSFGLPQSFFFTFKCFTDHIIAFGRLDSEELEMMRKEILGLNQELNNLNRMLQKKNSQLQETLDHVKTLQGIVPICMHCHNIRNDKQIWDKIDKYLAEHTDAEFSHGICPDCAEKYYPNMGLYDDEHAR